MNNERLNNINNGYIARKCIKPITHYFCAAVMYECGQIHTPDLRKGYDKVRRELIAFSKNHTGINPTGAIKSITSEDDLLEYFFNSRHNIPRYVYFWLNAYYRCSLGEAIDYKHKHVCVYNELQQMYIEHYRFCCREEKEDKLYNKSQRRKVCKAYRSGVYDTLFRLSTKPLSDCMTKQEIADISELLAFLFGGKLYGCDTAKNIAVGFILGRLQGRSEAIKNAFGISQSDALKMIIDNEHRTVKKGD